MEALAKLNHLHHPLPLALHYHRPSLSRPIYSLSFRTPLPPPLLPPSSLRSPSLSSSIKASSSLSNPLVPNPETPKPQLYQTLNPFPFSLLRTTLIATVTAAALFFARFNLKTLIAAPISPPPTVETATSIEEEALVDEDKERNLEEVVNSHPEDIQALRNLLELKIKSRKVNGAIQIIEQLIILEPEDNEWPLLKAHIYAYSGELENAIIGFNEILSKDPLRVEAYHGLVMVASQTESERELKKVEKRVVEGLELAKKAKKKDDLRDFKLLLAQIRVIEGNYNEALKIYEELVKEEPRDFRPYLCQGIIYTLLGKKDEAEKNFRKYQRLVPKGHPYAGYFDDNVMATKLFSQKVQNEKAGSRS